jgi:hypothetical protein
MKLGSKSLTNAVSAFGRISFLPEWLDPTIGVEKRAALDRAEAARAVRRTNAQPDFIAPEENLYLSPVSLTQLQNDVAAYNNNLSQGLIRPQQTTNWSLIAIGGLALVGLLMFSRK